MAHSKVLFYPEGGMTAGMFGADKLASALVFAAVLLCGAVGWAQVDQRVFWSERNAKPVGKAAAAVPIKKMVKNVGPAVVNIEVVVARAGGVFTEGRREVGQGSGFIITPDGYVLTNHHVVSGASDISVLLADNRRFEATVIGSDESTDVALIKLVDGDRLPVLSLGDSEDLGVGEWVVAIGSPLGLRSTVTAGIVSAKGRREVKPGEGAFYSNFIQTDASINPGNSGGPLLNMGGEVVAINTAINRHGQGIGFAIPINMVKSILPMLRNKGFVERSWMGIAIQALDRNLASSFGLKKAHGALVTSVDPSGPAATAGLQGGDIILGFNGKRILASAELPWAASLAGVGSTVTLKVWREGARRSMRMKLAAMPNQAAEKGREASGPKRPIAPHRHGIEVGQQEGRGVFVDGLEDGSPAKSSGLRLGDVVVEMDGEAVKDASGLVKALESSKGVIIRLKVRRLGATKYFAFPNP